MPVIEFFYRQAYLYRQEDLGELYVKTKAMSVDGQEFHKKDLSTLNAALVSLVWFYLSIIVCTNHYITKTFHTFLMIIEVEYELNSFIPLFCARITFHCRYLWLIFHYNITVQIENCSKTVAIYCNYNILNKITEALLSNNVLNAIFDPLLTMYMSFIHI